MTRPNKQQVEDTVRAVTHHNGQRIDWADQRRRLLHALQRDRTGSATPDGYPSGHNGGGGGKGGHGDPTSTAAGLRLEPVRDEHRRNVEEAWAHLQRAAKAVEAFHARLDLIEAETGKAPDPEQCESCLRANVNEDAAHWSDVVGRMNRLMRLCHACYMAVNRKAAQGDGCAPGDVLPPVEKIRAAYEGRRFREKAS